MSTILSIKYLTVQQQKEDTHISIICEIKVILYHMLYKLILYEN